MDGLIVILAIIAVIAQFSKLFKKGAAANKKRAPEAAQDAPKPAPKPVPASVWDQIQEMMTEGGEPDTEDAAGCVGGSIPHAQHEGDAPTGSLSGATILEREVAAGSGSLGGYTPLAARPVMAPRRERVPGTAAAHAPKISAPMSGTARYAPQDMQRAVVMAELLGKPVAMRRRREVGTH